MTYVASSAALPPQPERLDMPKLRTKSSTKRRFDKTGTGKLTRNYAGKRHNLRKRAQKMKRKARGTTLMAKADVRIVRKFMPNL